jgi:two-component system chemotaxis response regulator CheY
MVAKHLDLDVRVLVVDDNDHMRALLRAMLHAIGLRNVTEAHDGSHAMTRLREQEVDVVITDLWMEPLDGLDFVRLLRRSPNSPCPTVPIIMVTGHSTLHHVIEARDAGVDELLTKPVAARDLVDRLHQVVEHRRPYVRAGDYFGPERRRRADPAYDGPKRRAEDAGVVKPLWHG